MLIYLYVSFKTFGNKIKRVYQKISKHTRHRRKAKVFIPLLGSNQGQHFFCISFKDPCDPIQTDLSFCFCVCSYKSIWPKMFSIHKLWGKTIPGTIFTYMFSTLKMVQTLRQSSIMLDINVKQNILRYLFRAYMKQQECGGQEARNQVLI